MMKTKTETMDELNIENNIGLSQYRSSIVMAIAIAESPLDVIAKSLWEWNNMKFMYI